MFILEIFLTRWRQSSNLIFISKKYPSEDAVEGEILNFDPTKCFGFVQPKDAGVNIYFKFRTCVNLADEDVQLKSGLKVKVDLDGQKIGKVSTILYEYCHSLNVLFLARGTEKILTIV
jgi:cold shock CspA family protein